MTDTQAHDLKDLHVVQATLLKQRTKGSCLFVLFIICNYFIILYFTGYEQKAISWLVLASSMVGLVYLYGTKAGGPIITRDNVDRYLIGHVFLCGLTGLTWGGFSIYLIDWSSYFTLFVACVLVFSITVGGMLPSSAYRPGYIALSTFSLVPLAIYIMVYGSWPTYLMGFAILVYFAFGMITSARGELDLREAITARNTQAMTEKIKAQNQIIQRVNEEKKQFLAATSHDMSQPIHAQGYFIQALRKHLTQQDQHELLDKIEMTWHRQSQFLRGLMDMNQLDSGSLTSKPEFIDIQKEMRLLMDEFSEQSRMKGQELTWNFEKTRSYTDPTLLNRIVRNLLSNAIKYTPRLGTIHVEAWQHKDKCIITIEDSGTGISKQDQKRIFEEYVQLDSEPGHVDSGIGLGLSIVKKLCDFLKIQVKLSSAPGEGATFTLIIPTRKKDLDPGGGVCEKSEILTFQNTPLVVIVDDEAAIREAMTGLFTDWGCQVICGSGSETIIPLLAATAATPALLVVDKTLENGESGVDLIALLREEVNEDTPAILMSGGLLSQTEKEQLTTVQFLSKPVDPIVLNAILQNSLKTQS
ncbi:ATP-binding protein [Kordiimonas sp.]|uniref:ATP-binding protein n=1 Tax=Kordiimonas sp. TaxID=1970157 RepID=UPI003A951D77